MKIAKVSPDYEDWLIVFPRGKADGYFVAMKKNADGTVSSVSRSAFGLGMRGTLRPELETKSVTTKKEREWVDHCRRMEEKAGAVNDALYAVMKANEEKRGQS
jgi:hypothetical protein